MTVEISPFHSLTRIVSVKPDFKKLMELKAARITDGLRRWKNSIKHLDSTHQRRDHCFQQLATRA